MNFDQKAFAPGAVAPGPGVVNASFRLAVCTILVVVASLSWAPPAAALASGARVIPLLQCVEPGFVQIVNQSSPDVQLTAHLGYYSEAVAPATIPLSDQGDVNYFTPGTPIRGQPTEFLPGSHENVFSTTWNGTRTPTLTWNLDGQSVSMGINPADYCATEVDSVSPAMTGHPGDTIDVTVTGKNFALQSKVEVHAASRSTVLPTGEITDITFQSIKFRFYIPENVLGGLYTIDIVGPTANTSFSLGNFEVVVPTSITAMVLTPSGALFAGTARDGIFRSTNNGQMWTAVNNGLQTLRINALVLSGDGSIIFAGTAGGVYRSLDNGQSWALMSAGMP